MYVHHTCVQLLPTCLPSSSPFADVTVKVGSAVMLLSSDTSSASSTSTLANSCQTTKRQSKALLMSECMVCVSTLTALPCHCCARAANFGARGLHLPHHGAAGRRGQVCEGCLYVKMLAWFVITCVLKHTKTVALG